MSDLETPSNAEDVYFAVGEEISPHRPMFTGDVYESDDRLWMVVQHPCAIRRGTALNSKILVAPVSIVDSLRSDWRKCPYKIMPLPAMIEKQDHCADFVDLDLALSDVLASSLRHVTLSHYGVNLLLQRWLHHNSRVVVPTATLSTATVGPFNEAELTEEWVEERTEYGVAPTDALGECDRWLDLAPESVRRRDELSDPQHASRIRREARQHWKSLN